MSLTTLSYGGGVQSTALLVLSATGVLPKVDAALFSNVGDDSEHLNTAATSQQLRAPSRPRCDLDVGLVGSCAYCRHRRG